MRGYALVVAPRVDVELFSHFTFHDDNTACGETTMFIAPSGCLPEEEDVV